MEDPPRLHVLRRYKPRSAFTLIQIISGVVEKGGFRVFTHSRYFKL